MTCKPFDIPKTLIWEAWLNVKANQGAAGIDAETFQPAFHVEQDPGILAVLAQSPHQEVMIEIIERRGHRLPITAISRQR